jgi:hypothetical protein
MASSSVDRPTPQRRSTTTVDLGALREPFVEVCAAEGISPSEGLRRLIAAALEGGNGVQAVQAKRRGRAPRASKTDGKLKAVTAPCKELRGHADLRRRRVVVRLSESEWAAANEIAHAEGFTLARWIGAGVRARLVGGAQLGTQELQHLADSSYQLRAIGRNLNQFVRAVNADVSEASRMRSQLVADLTDRVEAHLDQVRRLIESNLERWKVETRE